MQQIFRELHLSDVLEIAPTAGSTASLRLALSPHLWAKDIYVGGSASGPGGVGILQLDDGRIDVTNGITVYDTASGTNVSHIALGGTVTASALTMPNWDRMSLGGNLTLTHGPSVMPGDLLVPYSANMSQYGDSAVSADNLYVGNLASDYTIASYSLGSTSPLAVSNAEYIGYDGAGTFNHYGGSNSAPQLFLGYNPTARGSYIQTGGAAPVGEVYVGGS